MNNARRATKSFVKSPPSCTHEASLMNYFAFGGEISPV